jgi:uncharacterized protein YutD
MERIKKNIAKLEENDRKAAEKGSLIGRYIQESYADGYAYYVITKVKKNTVTIKSVKGIGDDWEIPYWGGLDKMFGEVEVTQK